MMRLALAAILFLFLFSPPVLRADPPSPEAIRVKVALGLSDDSGTVDLDEPTARWIARVSGRPIVLVIAQHSPMGSEPVRDAILLRVARYNGDGSPRVVVQEYCPDDGEWETRISSHGEVSPSLLRRMIEDAKRKPSSSVPLPSTPIYRLGSLGVSFVPPTPVCSPSF